jgi:hypothetical protein
MAHGRVCSFPFGTNKEVVMAAQASHIDEPAAGREFVASCYEVFLGRDIDLVSVVDERGQWPVPRVVQSFLDSGEFGVCVYERIRSGQVLDGIYGTPLVARHRYWAVEKLPISQETASDVIYAKSWREMLRYLLADKGLMALGNRPALEVVPDVEMSAPEDGPEIFALSDTAFDPRLYPIELRDAQGFWTKPSTT